MQNTEITFYLSQDIHSKLKEDQKSFHMGTVESAFIKRIIVNYYDIYSKEKEDLENKIRDSISSFSYVPSKEDCSDISWQIIKFLDENKAIRNDCSKHKRLDKLHLRINKNEIVLESNLDSLAQYARLSESLTSLFQSYLDKPKYERERIIFKDVFERLQKAISKNRQVKIKAKSNEREETKFKIIDPKEVHVSKEELFNYLLYKDERDGKECASSIHLYNIISVVLEPKSCNFSKQIISYFERMKINGVQYSISDDIVYKVKLSEKGKKLYQRNLKYIERPIALGISNPDEGIYCFDCSKMQLENYFSSFYEHMEILEPLEYRKDYCKKLEKIIEMYKK